MKKEEITEIGWCVESPIGDFVFGEPYSLQKKEALLFQEDQFNLVQQLMNLKSDCL